MYILSGILGCSNNLRLSAHDNELCTCGIYSLKAVLVIKCGWVLTMYKFALQI